MKAHPKYEFGYEVTDHHTGDSHYQKESRDGDKVVGEYALKEPGGNVRTVKYVADKHGFHPVVHNSHGRAGDCESGGLDLGRLDIRNLVAIECWRVSSVPLPNVDSFVGTQRVFGESLVPCLQKLSACVLTRSPRKSAGRQNVELCLINQTMKRILKNDLHYRPYKIQVFKERPPKARDGLKEQIQQEFNNIPLEILRDVMALQSLVSSPNVNDPNGWWCCRKVSRFGTQGRSPHKVERSGGVRGHSPSATQGCTLGVPSPFYTHRPDAAELHGPSRLESCKVSHRAPRPVQTATKKISKENKEKKITGALPGPELATADPVQVKLFTSFWVAGGILEYSGRPGRAGFHQPKPYSHYAHSPPYERIYRLMTERGLRGGVAIHTSWSVGHARWLHLFSVRASAVRTDPVHAKKASVSMKREKTTPSHKIIPHSPSQEKKLE
uniref:Uncharacterized protein n=1 Tax=Timema douglasi TaxID=61478 RepID=A0A7R8VQZ1_TIMDO|nr:unnamed protein product [Timema douglasi]